MKVGSMNVKITIQKQTAGVDAIGNHTNTWTDWHTCWAIVSGEDYHAKEAENKHFTQDTTETRFSVRWCNATKVIDSTHYRVMLDGMVFNIIDIDHRGYARKEIMLKCKNDLEYGKD